MSSPAAFVLRERQQTVWPIASLLASAHVPGRPRAPRPLRRFRPGASVFPHSSAMVPGKLFLVPAGPYLRLSNLAGSSLLRYLPSQLAAEVRWARCLRSHGLPNFPDPDAQGAFDSSRFDESSPAFQTASNACKSLQPAGPTPVHPGRGNVSGP